MNVLEQWTDEQLTRVPSGPSADDLRRRARVRRNRRVGASLAAVAIVLAILGIAAMLRSPAPRHVEVLLPAPTIGVEPTTTLPDAINVPGFSNGATEPKDKRNSVIYDKINHTVSGAALADAADPKAPVDFAEVVVTTRHATIGEFGDTPNGAGDRRYVVQVVGDLDCRSCRGPGNGPFRGRVMALLFDAAGDGVGFTFGGEPQDLSRLGTVYRMPIGLTT